MKYELPQLPYAYNALEPYIDAETMKIHHGKHHQAYIDKLNAVLEKYPQFAEENLESLLAKLPSLAFDHKKILAYALARVGNKIQYSNIIWSLLPRHFTLTDIQKMYETIWGRRLDKRNFRKKLLSLGLIKPARKVLKGLRQRPAQLFAFKTTKLVELRRFF